MNSAMSSNNPLLKSCRFHRGESSNPYEDKDRDKAMLWFYEMGWVKNAESGIPPASSDAIDEYERCGLRSFHANDGVPLSLKALLFNRYAKTEQSMFEAVEPFKAFYEQYYT